MHTVQTRGYVVFVQRFVDEPAIDQVDGPDFVIGARHQNNSIRLQAFMLATLQFAFHQPALIDEDPAKAVACRAALPKAQFNESALAGEHLRREFAAVFAGHCALDALDDG